MARPPAAALCVTPAQREVLEAAARSSASAHREVVRAQVLLDAADGTANIEIARRHPVSVVTIRAWRAAFEAEGLTGWGKVKQGRGRKPQISGDKIAEIVELTARSTPPGHTHWSCRTMAD